jgi:hypothetical protein
MQIGLQLEISFSASNFWTYGRRVALPLPFKFWQLRRFWQSWRLVTMRILRWMKQAILFVFDPEIYFLAWIAVRNQLRPGRTAQVPPPRNVRKRAKAVNSD